MSGKTLHESVPLALRRLVLFAALWWALAGADAWTVGAPAVLLATGASLRLAPRRAPWRLWPALRFLAFFIVQSLYAGFDVALRAFAPRPRLAPALIDYRLRLPPGPVRVLFANVVSLVPGTLSTELTDKQLRVHVLDAGLPVASQLRVLEAHVGAVFGFNLRGTTWKRST
jgi:multicomponent Na+:H+ antiporter subunit E